MTVLQPVPPVIKWDDIPWEFMREGVERKLQSSKNATVQLTRLMPGHEPRPHSHPNEQIAYILAGQIDFFVNDEVRRVGPGEMLIIPPDARHWGEVVGDVPVLNLDIFTPRRED
jgi:quercetin dioxygenase-like cupin family protein